MLEIVAALLGQVVLRVMYTESATTIRVSCTSHARWYVTGVGGKACLLAVTKGLRQAVKDLVLDGKPALPAFGEVPWH